MKLPDFPVDPGTLDAIEEAVHATYDSTTNTLDELLELLSGWTPAGEETVHDGARVVDTGPLYSREDVILALITAVRKLRGGEFCFTCLRGDQGDDDVEGETFTAGGITLPVLHPHYGPVVFHQIGEDGSHAENCPGCAP